MMYRILSPHMDDAALGLYDHIMAWKSGGLRVKVETLFTSFSTTGLTPHARRYLEMSGFTSVEAFEKARKSEDEAVMKAMGIEYKWHELVDGGFRSLSGKPVYPNFRELFQRKRYQDEPEVRKLLEEKMKKMRGSERILVPLGVGGHADHWLVRITAERVFSKGQLRYYADYPYTLKPKHWNRELAGKVLFERTSLRWTSQEKRRAMKQYASQVKQLFSGFYTYPELVFR